jgi:hypothetical protein
MSISNDRDNPFAPPKAALLEPSSEHGHFVADGRKLAAGRGWAWFSEAWPIFMRAPGMWVLMFVVFMVLSILFAIIPLGGLVSSIAYPAVAAGLMIGSRELEEGGSLRMGHFIEGFKRNAGSLLLVGVLYLVGTLLIVFVVFAGMAIAFPLVGGTLGPDGVQNLGKIGALLPLVLIGILLVIALMLPLVMAIWFAPALVAFHDLQPMAAMKSSFFGCLRNIVPFLIYGIAGLVLAIVALLPFGLGFLVFGPIMWITMYTGYRDIFLER